MKANVFAQHPAGFRIHVELDDSRIPPEEAGEIITSAEVARRLLTNLGILTKWLADQHYTGEYVGTAPQNGSAPSTSPTAASTANPKCEVCGGPTEYKEGVSKKNNRPWKGYFCINTKNAPRNGQHPTIWIDE